MHLALVLELLVDRFKFATEIFELTILLVRFLLELEDLRAELELKCVLGSAAAAIVPLAFTNTHLLEIVSERCRFGLLGFEVRFLFRQPSRKLFDLVRQRLNVCLLLVEQLWRSTRTESALSETRGGIPQVRPKRTCLASLSRSFASSTSSLHSSATLCTSSL